MFIQGMDIELSLLIVEKCVAHGFVNDLIV